MEYKVSTPRCFRNCKIMKPASFNKILQANAANYTRIPDADEIRYINERPMMLSMWTQTYSEDFDFLKELDPMADKIDKVKNDKSNALSESELALLEKIRVLEKTLSAQSEIIEQIHATSSRKITAMVEETIEQQHHQQHQQVQPQQQPSYVHYDEHMFKAEDTNSNNFITPIQSPSSSQVDAATASASSVINAVGQVPPTTESYKYTIIADGHNNGPNQPIEIEISTDEDENGTLNTSSDSARLEICLADDQTDGKTVVEDTQQFQNIETDEIPLKRCRSESVIKNHDEIMKNEGKDIKNTINIIRHEKYTPRSYVPLKEQLQQHQEPQQEKPKPRIPDILKRSDFQKGTPMHLENQSFRSKMNMENIMIPIGPNNTRIPVKVYESMSWKSPSIATRKLLMAVFDRHTLATHSMTGKPSPAFKNQKPMKQMLDPHVIQDIIFVVTRKCNVSDKQVRNAITTKCADENKMMKLQLCKQERDMLRELNKENCAALSSQN